MSRIMRRTFAAMSAGVLLITTLSGCGSSQATVKDGAFDAKQPIPASQAFNTKSIWYVCSKPNADEGETYGKDTSTTTMLVFDGEGKVTTYNYQIKLGKLKGKTDEQIIEDAKKQDEVAFSNAKKQALSNLDRWYNDRIPTEDGETLDSIEDQVREHEENMHAAFGDAADGIDDKFGDYLESQKKEYENNVATYKPAYEKLKPIVEKIRYEAPTPQPYTLSVTTDSTGNQTAEETFEYAYQAFTFGSDERDYDSWLSNPTEVNGYYKQTNQVKLSPIGNFQVYDAWYGGYDELLTRVKQDNPGFVLDSPKIEGVKVDGE